jgi:hypothetical protein
MRQDGKEIVYVLITPQFTEEAKGKLAEGLAREVAGSTQVYAIFEGSYVFDIPGINSVG